MKKPFILFAVLAMAVLAVHGQRTFYFTVSMPDSLVAYAGNDLYVTPGNSATIGGTPAVTGGTAPIDYLWTPGIFLNDSTLSNPHVTPLYNQTYILTVVDGNNCIANDDIIVSTDSSSINNNAAYAGTHAPVVYCARGKGVIVDFSPFVLKSGTAEIGIFDLQGKELLSCSCNLSSETLKEIRLDYPSGLLFVRIVATGLTWNYKLYVK